MEKNPDISDNSLCTGHASGRIGNSAWHSLCYRGRSQDQFFQAYHDQGAEQNTEDHRSQKRAEDHLEEQQFQNRHCKQSCKLFAKSAGNATITAQVNGIRFVCKVKIQKKAAPAKPTPTAAPKPGIKLKNHILSKGKKASDGSVKIELNTHDESKKIDMDLGGLGSSSSMQVSVDEYRSITYIPKNNSFKFYFRFSSHDDLKSDITLTFPMNSTAASLNFYFYMSILPDDESGTLIATMSSSAPLSAIRNESSNLSFHFQKLTNPYEVLTQKDASELANDTLDMAVPYWADLLKGSGITLRSLGFSTTK